MNPYPILTELGIEHWDEGGSLGWVCKAQDVERLFRRSEMVVGSAGIGCDWKTKNDRNVYKHTHQAYVAGIHLIPRDEKKISAAEFDGYLETFKVAEEKVNIIEFLERLRKYGFEVKHG